MAVVGRKHLQASYSGLQKSLQQKWVFVQCAAQGLGEDFQQWRRPYGRSSFWTSSLEHRRTC